MEESSHGDRWSSLILTPRATRAKTSLLNPFYVQEFRRKESFIQQVHLLRGELDSAIDSYVPMKKQGKRSKKKHLSKEAFRKIRHKQHNVEGL